MPAAAVDFWGRSRPPAGTPLDRGHPLAAAVVWAAICNEYGSRRVTDLGNGVLPLSLRTATTSLGPGGLRCLNTSDGAEATLPTSLYLKRPVTLAALITQVGTPSASANIFGLTLNNSDTSPWEGYQLEVASTSVYSAATSAPANTFQETKSTLAPSSRVGTQVSLVAVFGPTQTVLYIDGVQAAITTTTLADPSFGSSALLAAGAYTGPAARNANLILHVGLVAKRAWGQADAQAFSANPYGVFLPPIWRRYSIAPSLPPGLGPSVHLLQSAQIPAYRLAPRALPNTEDMQGTPLALLLQPSAGQSSIPSRTFPAPSRRPEGVAIGLSLPIAGGSAPTPTPIGMVDAPRRVVARFTQDMSDTPLPLLTVSTTPAQLPVSAEPPRPPVRRPEGIWSPQLASSLAGAPLPFIPSADPTPLTRPYPLALRTWGAELLPALAGADQFYAAGGQTPSWGPDLPPRSIPRIRPDAARGPSLLLAGTDQFYGDPGQSPTRGPDLPPRAAPRVRLDAAGSALVMLLAPDVPNAQVSLALPVALVGRRALIRVDLTPSPITLQVAPALPDSRGWADVGLPVRITPRPALAPSITLSLLGADQFYAAGGQAPTWGPDLPPRPVARVRLDAVLGTLLGTLFVPPGGFLPDGRASTEPLPLARPAPRLYATNGLNLLIQGTDRFYGDPGQSPSWGPDLPPRGVARVRLDALQAALQVTLLAAPAGLPDGRSSLEPAPPARRPERQHTAVRLSLTLLGQDVFYGGAGQQPWRIVTDLAPRGPRQPTSPSVGLSLSTMIASASVQPPFTPAITERRGDPWRNRRILVGYALPVPPPPPFTQFYAAGEAAPWGNLPLPPRGYPRSVALLWRDFVPILLELIEITYAVSGENTGVKIEAFADAIGVTYQLDSGNLRVNYEADSGALS